jgi:hypothetical protein
MSDYENKLRQILTEIDQGKYLDKGGVHAALLHIQALNDEEVAMPPSPDYTELPIPEILIPMPDMPSIRSCGGVIRSRST